MVDALQTCASASASPAVTIGFMACSGERHSGKPDHPISGHITPAHPLPNVEDAPPLRTFMTEHPLAPRNARPALMRHPRQRGLHRPYPPSRVPRLRPSSYRDRTEHRVHFSPRRPRLPHRPMHFRAKKSPTHGGAFQEERILLKIGHQDYLALALNSSRLFLDQAASLEPWTAGYSSP